MSLYEETVDISGESVLAGKLDGQTTTLTELREGDIGILREFADDIDIQMIKLCSTNIGFARQYQKRFATHDGQRR